MVDANSVGLADILTQQGKIIAYASKALSEVEQRYCQTEREALAIVWACEHFHLYLFGHKFNLVSDCRPLEVVFNNANSKPKARIERWRLRLQGYDFNVTYKQGNKNIADYISRHVSYVCMFSCFTSQVNSYGHCGTVSSLNHTFSWAGLNKRLTSSLCTYFRL